MIGLAAALVALFVNPSAGIALAAVAFVAFVLDEATDRRR